MENVDQEMSVGIKVSVVAGIVVFVTLAMYFFIRPFIDKKKVV